MKDQVKRSVLSCDFCQRVKILNCKMEGKYHLVKAESPGKLVSVDFYGPLPTSSGGVKYIFVVLDVFTKYIKLYPMKRANTHTVLRKILDDYIPIMGKPKRILAGVSIYCSCVERGS